ncbi:MAG: choice-of-anchor J domain-containing protein [Nonlabens sp.]|uniref:choice-of-anchor J domain-containing protein n=1 Tax=Nonlabens sp. TaxID=1888209 RepID=UPI003EF87DC3
MKLKLLLLGAFAMLLSICGSAQTTTIIGTGTSPGTTGSNGSPIYRSTAGSSFDYSQSVLLYTFADLSAAGIYNGAVISSIGFNKTNAFGVAPGEAGSMTIGMNNSGSNSLDTSDTFATLTTGFTNVYTSAAVDETIISATPGYVVFTLDTPFTYTGGSIEIGLDWDISVSTGNPTTGGFAFAYDTVTDVQGRGTSAGSPITGNLTTGNTRLYQAQMIYTGGTAPTCLPSTNLGAVSTTFDTADLSWTTGGSGETLWDVELGAEGFTPTGTPTDPGVTNPYTATSLTANTGYDFYVRADCGGGDYSAWAGPFNFRTLCVAVTDFNENFDAVSTPDLPSCWTSFNTTPVGTTAAVVQTSTAGDSSAPNGVRMYSGSLTGNIGSGTTDEGENMLISPQLSNLAAGTYRIRFSADAGTTTSTLEVGTMADQTDPSTFTSLGTFSPTTTHAEYIQNFDTYSGTDQFIAFRHVFAGTFDTMYLDDIVWEAIPSCSNPTAFAASAISDTAVSLTWSNNASAAASSILYGPTGFDPLTAGTTVPGGADSATVTGLTAETAYDFYVTQDCTATGDGLSPQIGPASATTLCAALVPDTIETFDTFVPNCWEEASTGDLTTGPMTLGSGDWGVEEFAHASTSGGGAVNVNLFNANTSDWVLSPLYDLSAGGYELNVDVAVTAYNSTAASAMGSDDQVLLLYTEDGTTWNILETWDVTNTPSATGDTYNNPLTGLTSATTQFALYATEGTVDDPEDLDFHMDNFQVRTPPTCPDTANLTLVSSTDVEATINFDSGNATSAGNYEYSLTTVAGTAPAVTGAWTDVAGANPNVTYTITGLTAETEYFVHVREVCAVGDESAWTFVPLNFTTACAAIAAPYTDDLEGFTPTTSFTLENCWSEVSPGGFAWDLDGSGGTGSTNTGPSGANSGTNFFFTEASGSAFGDTAILQSPAVDLSALTVPSLIFQSHLYGGSIGTFDILVSANGGAFTSVYSIVGQQQAASADAWSENIIDLSAYAGQTIVVRFSHTTADNANGSFNYDADVAIDDISFTELPVCNDVSAVMVDSVTSDSATVSWTENSLPPATAWEVVAVPTGDPAPAVGTSNATVNPYTITALTPETTYDIYVRADCSTTFVGPISATTDCAVIVPNAIETFDTFVPNCWEEASTGDLTTGPMTLGSGDWGAEEFAHATTSGGGAVNVNLYNLGTSDWVLSPLYDLSAGGYELNVDVAVTAYNSTAAIAMGSDDQVILLYTEDGTTWNTLVTWDASNTPSATGETYNNPLTGLTGATTQFAFYATEGTVDDAEDLDFHMDNFQVRTPPTCPDTSNLTVVGTTDVDATINFDSGNPTSAGNYEYSLTTVAGTAPAVSGAWTDVAGATPNVTYTITGLTAQTEYFVHVREVCAVGDESAWSITPVNFTTACAPIAAPYAEDFELFTTSTAAFTIENCWSGTGGSYYWESAPGTDTGSGGTGPAPSITTGNYFYTEASSGSAGDTTDLVSPLVDLTALTAPSLAFNYHMFGGQIGTLDVLVNGTTNVWTLSGQQQASDVTPWELATVDLTAYAGQTISVTFRATSAGTFEGDIAIDNVNFDELPSCVDVTGITVDSTTSDSVTISWTENNVPAATAWEVIAVPAGDPAPTAGTTNATANPFTIGSLMANTSYDVYVRTDCNTTAFAGPVSFTTDCSAVTMFPAATDFTNNVPNACWSEAGDGEIATGPTGVGASEWKDGRAYTNGIGTVVPSNVMNLYRQGDREWLISETYDLSSLTTKILTIEVAVTDYTFSGTSTAADTGVMGSDDTVDLLVTTDNGVTWTSLDTWNAANQPAVIGDSYFYDLAAYTGTVQFAFLASDGAVDDLEDFDFHVSRFVVDATAGNNDAVLENTVSLYPNPVSGDTMTINLGNVPVSDASIMIYNTLGQEVMYRNFNNVSNSTLVVDNLSSLTTGVYLVHISNGSSTTVKRFIKQ